MSHPLFGGTFNIMCIFFIKNILAASDNLASQKTTKIWGGGLEPTTQKKVNASLE